MNGELAGVNMTFLANVIAEELNIPTHNAIENMNQLSDANLSENDMLQIKKNLFDAKREYLSGLAGQFFVGSVSVLGIYQLISGDKLFIRC
ncbi:hypothetical protein [Paenisporosarcina indica]|uniref:hypothetical protein n=1 Tax=Paenisporosarcina indica TaxID=650093 RepID=UPI000950066D|nr:hypothetical protein [Paenisporosarcina indica]